jgi:hypothetical protein
MFGVWPLRILIRSVLGFRRFIVSAISAICARPSQVQVQAILDHPKHTHKLLEVMALGRSERMLLEERNDVSHEIPPIRYHVLLHVLAVVIVPLVAVDVTNPEELLQFFKASHAAGSLRHGKPGRNLIAEFVAAPLPSVALPNEAD